MHHKEYTLKNKLNGYFRDPKFISWGSAMTYPSVTELRIMSNYFKTRSHMPCAANEKKITLEEFTAAGIRSFAYKAR